MSTNPADLADVVTRVDLVGAEEFVAAEAAVVGDPFDDVLYGPMMDEKFALGFEKHRGWIRDHHTVHGSTATGRITNAHPRKGFLGDPERGLFYHSGSLQKAQMDTAAVEADLDFRLP
ncbi:hypothetical protein ALI22I_15755 [Saccharothrix sp. ALI-22-I]|uniref:hypothetical protein n=1 Tax=Saccharothrix sp. ALI-22-I TaxID=1933778 RepID=UPI00097BDC18|nr:hypothetical protein [Saccharothrix sp. ALI-22-I]ONI89468.1 hypothetical protein ALI22I_15755 [Saccharothrix sp. ALI-22-I]